MQSRVLETIRAQALVEQGDRLVVGISGGPDSTALLLVLHRLANRLGIVSLQAVTIDHGLRPEARAEGEAVSAFCASLGVPWRGVEVDVAAFRDRHVSLQDAARRARLSALAEVAAEQGARVALGHTADDQAETVLFRIVRGTGLRGLAGIPYRRDPFVRPLLDVRRREVVAWLGRRRVSYLEDPSNRDDRFARARVRFSWLPMLARENPRVVEALLGLAKAARRDGRTGELEGRTRDDGGLPIDGASRAARATIDRLRLRGRGSRRVHVPGGTVEIEYGRARFLPVGSAEAAADEPAPIDVPGPGRYRWPPRAKAGATEIEIVGGEGEAGPPPGITSFAQSSFDRGPWVLRGPRPGDRMFPRGGVGSRKLSDLLIDAKIPRAARPSLPVLTTRDGVILFVAGLRPSERERPPPGVRSWVEIRIRGGDAADPSLGREPRAPNAKRV